MLQCIWSVGRVNTPSQSPFLEFLTDLISRWIFPDSTEYPGISRFITSCLPLASKGAVIRHNSSLSTVGFQKWPQEDSHQPPHQGSSNVPWDENGHLGSNFPDLQSSVVHFQDGPQQFSHQDPSIIPWKEIAHLERSFPFLQIERFLEKTDPLPQARNAFEFPSDDFALFLANTTALENMAMDVAPAIDGMDPMMNDSDTSHVFEGFQRMNADIPSNTSAPTTFARFTDLPDDYPSNAEQGSADHANTSFITKPRGTFRRAEDIEIMTVQKKR